MKFMKSRKNTNKIPKIVCQNLKAKSKIQIENVTSSTFLRAAYCQIFFNFMFISIKLRRAGILFL